MLRPATILSVFIFVAFALMLVATISTPIIKAIPLGKVDDVTFGVFGYCKGDDCSGITIGYDPSEFLKADEAKFKVPSSVRDSLTTILIVHPIAAFLTLVLFIMATSAHLRTPSNSPRYLLVLFLVSVLAFLVCLLSFIVDILLFVPHTGFASYLVVAATVMVGLSGLFICVMRRTLISRKDRTNRIAENAEMSGENYYNREAQKSSGSRQPTMPSVSGANGNGDSLPTFTSFEDDKPDERIPLTQPSPSERSAQLARAGTGSPVNALGEPVRSNSVGPLGSDQYGNPMGPSPGDYAGYRGIRGSYGGGGAYAAAPARGAYGQQARGSYGSRGGGYGGARGGGAAYQNQAGSYDRRPSPVNAYGGHGQHGQGSNDSYTTANTGNTSHAYGAYGAYGSDYPRAESPPDIASSQPGQAIEMQGTTTAITTPTPTAHYGPIRDSDTDVAGMVGLQQGLGGNRQPTESYLSDGSRYSNDDPHGQYVPPRTGWNQNQTGRHSPSVPSPLAIGRSTPAADRNSPENGRTAYYDDVDSQYTADPRARSPQWGGFPGGRPTPQNSSPDLRGRGGLSPPPARGGGYNAF